TARLGTSARWDRLSRDAMLTKFGLRATKLIRDRTPVMHATNAISHWNGRLTNRVSSWAILACLHLAALAPAVAQPNQPGSSVGPQLEVPASETKPLGADNLSTELQAEQSRLDTLANELEIAEQ